MLTERVRDLKYRVLGTQGWTNGDSISFTTRMILIEAETWGITWEEVPGTRIFKLDYKGEIKYFHQQIPFSMTEVGFNSCLDKATTRAFLLHAGVCIAKGFQIKRSDDKSYWTEVFHALPKPLVVKPSHGNQGRSVFMGVTDLNAYTKAVQDSFDFSKEDDSSVIVEETFQGTEYRITASNEKVLGIMNRVPANVVGDGQKTIQELVDIKNSDPRRSVKPTDSLCQIKIDEHVKQHMADQGLTLQTVPKAGERVFLRLNSNISTGGDSIDVTDIAHPSVKELSMKVMNAIPGLPFAGIDLMTKDITAEQTPDNHIFIEVNGSPGFSIHDFPFEGKSRNIKREFLYLLYPALKNEPNPPEAW